MKNGSSEEPNPRNYFVPHFGEDGDIKDSKKNMIDTEVKLGKWNF